MSDTDVRKAVREGYARVASGGSSCCGGSGSCCGDGGATVRSREVGYSGEELESVPEGANLGLGCGNPLAFSSLKGGETVLDLGAGPGLDCFLAAKKVGPEGKVIGVDMTPEMLERARRNARDGGFHNVEFRLGEIENLPVADGIVDLVVSNCVINLSPDKRRVFGEAFRVLKPGGGMMVSDIVMTGTLPETIMKSVGAYVGCISGAMMRDDYLDAARAAGFAEVQIVEETSFPWEYLLNDPAAKALMEEMSLGVEDVKRLADSLRSVRVKAVKAE